MHTNESQVLERLYYKGRNQHRGALFWRRVVEVRRYSGRLEGIRIDNVVEILRHSFFGEGAYENPKLIKGSWTHFPDIPSMLFTTERLSACSALVKKMHMRLIDAYRFLTLAMQSGAFLQLILTLIALVSRLGTICLEVLEAIQGTTETIRGILEVAPNIGWPVHGSDSKAPIAAVSIGADGRKERLTSSPSAMTEVTTPHTSPIMGPLPLFGTDVRRTVIKSANSDREIPQDKVHILQRNKKRPKKRVKKDEIDIIFGF